MWYLATNMEACNILLLAEITGIFENIFSNVISRFFFRNKPAKTVTCIVTSNMHAAGTPNFDKIVHINIYLTSINFS